MTNILRWRRYTSSALGIDEVLKNLLVKCVLPIAKTGWEVGGQDYFHRVSFPTRKRRVMSNEMSSLQISQQLPNELATLEIKAELGILES